jgi:aspartate/methionine/tyrosine aminotransferase
VIVTAGSQESLYLILRTLVQEGDEVLIPNAFMVSDEIYRELNYTTERPPSISEFYRHLKAIAARFSN